MAVGNEADMHRPSMLPLHFSDCIKPVVVGVLQQVDRGIAFRHETQICIRRSLKNRGQIIRSFVGFFELNVSYSGKNLTLHLNQFYRRKEV